MPDPTPAAPASPPATPPAAAPATPPAKPDLLAGDPAPSGAPSGAPAAPEEIKVKFPDGFKIDAPAVDKFLGVAKKAGLKSESAQAVADLYVEMQNSAAAAQDATIVQWAEEAKSDPEIGGANFDKSLVAAKKALDKLATPELRKFLSESGMGNHKEVIRMLARVGNGVSEDRLVDGGEKGRPPETSRIEQLKAAFPNSPDMWK